MQPGGAEVHTRDVDIAVVDAAGVLDDAAGAGGMLCNLELPVRVAIQIKAWLVRQSGARTCTMPALLFTSQGPSPPRQLHHLPSVP